MPPSRYTLFALISGCLLAAAGTAHGSCNNVPNASFRGARGSIDHPYASPGDLVMVGSVCSSPALTEINDEKSFLVTLVFKPFASALPNLLVLTAEADCTAVEAKLPKPDDLPGLGLASARCVAVGTGAGGLGIVQVNGAPHLTFGFPDTDAQVPGAGRTYTGPTTVAVTLAANAIPVGLAKQHCSAVTDPKHPLVCVDDLFEPGSATPCAVGKKYLGPVFGSFTALPLPNPYAEICTTGPGCTGGATELRFAVDARGTAFVPMGWTPVLASIPNGQSKRPKRVVLASTAVSPRGSKSEPIRIPDDSFLSSATERGAPFPQHPLFKLGVPPGNRDQELTLEGDVDKEHSVLVIERRKPWRFTCDGGTRNGEACHQAASGDCPAASCVQKTQAKLFFCSDPTGLPCTRRMDCSPGNVACKAASTCREPLSGATTDPTPACSTDADCEVAGEECGPGVFEFRDRLSGSIGPVVIPTHPTNLKRGVCKGGQKDGKRCNHGCGANSVCVGYRARVE
jgi:hypothetical protein